MQFLRFKEELKNFPLFDLNDIRKIDGNFDLRRLSEWQEKGYIQKLRRGHYFFPDLKLNEDTIFLLANHLYAPSYISLESALAYYSLIPEGVYAVTSITSNKTIVFENPVARFEYKSIKSEFMFGYRLMNMEDKSYRIAESEKAVLDCLYFNPEVASERAFYEWRFNSHEFKRIADMEKLRSYAKLFNIKAFSVRVERFLSLVELSE